MNDLQAMQVEMHKDLFERCKSAIDCGYYFEAVMMEYAAIEGRLEVMLSLMGLPCGKDCRNKQDVKISSRIQCLQYIRDHSPNFENSKLPMDFYKKNGIIKKWIRERDICVHGLYKRPEEYLQRKEAAKELAERGLEIVIWLYADAKRMRRLANDHPDRFCDCNGMCQNGKCKAYMTFEQ